MLFRPTSLLHACIYTACIHARTGRSSRVSSVGMACGMQVLGCCPWISFIFGHCDVSAPPTSFLKAGQLNWSRHNLSHEPTARHVSCHPCTHAFPHAATYTLSLLCFGVGRSMERSKEYGASKRPSEAGPKVQVNWCGIECLERSVWHRVPREVCVASSA